jgi:hypothetical protein
LLDLVANLPSATAADKDRDGAAEEGLLLLLARLDLAELPGSSDGPAVPQPAASSTAKTAVRSETEQQLLKMLFADASIVRMPDPAAMERKVGVDLADRSWAALNDAWIRINGESAPTEALPLDATGSRQAPPTITAFVDAIRLATNGGPSADVDSGSDTGSGSNRSQIALDRSIAKIGGSIHLVQPAPTFETTLGNARAASVAAAEARLPNEANITSSIVQSMRLQMRDGVGTAVVRLEPDYLGAVSIALRVEGGTVTATLHAENPQVRAWMEANEPLLRQGLSDQGLSLDRLLISGERLSEERLSERRRQQQQEQQPPARQKSRRADAGTFEVVV